jgi:hypothetical protein
MPPRVLALLLATVGALVGIAISFAILGAPRMLESQPLNAVLIAGLKIVGLFALIYVPGTLAYGAVLLWGTTLWTSRSFVAFIGLGVLPALLYSGYALVQFGASSGWEAALLFHGIPCLIASAVLWVTSMRGVT